MVKWRIAFMKNAPSGYIYLNAVDKTVSLTRLRGCRSCCKANVIFALELFRLPFPIIANVGSRSLARHAPNYAGEAEQAIFGGASLSTTESEGRIQSI
jgi:hypothetical protein